MARPCIKPLITALDAYDSEQEATGYRAESLKPDRNYSIY